MALLRHVTHWKTIQAKRKVYLSFGKRESYNVHGLGPVLFSRKNLPAI